MDERYRGMTVNERLYSSGLMQDFDRCVQIKDVDGLKRILAEVGIADEPTMTSIIAASLKADED